MVSHWSLNDSKSPKVSRTLLRIQADLSNAPLVLLFPSPLVHVSILLWLYQEYQLQLESQSLSCSIVFFNFQLRSWYLSFFSLSFNFTECSTGTAKSTIPQVLFFYWLLHGLVIWLRLGDLFVSQNPWGVCVSHFPRQILGCTYTICLYGQI